MRRESEIMATERRRQYESKAKKKTGAKRMQSDIIDINTVHPPTYKCFPSDPYTTPTTACRE
jgi:hypothetical protein